MNMHTFNCGALFLIRTPETFPEGYAAQAFEDMKALHLDYAAWLETWNCMDGIVWPHPDYPRSSFWKGCPRDPLEETFAAADAVGMAFLPECGVMDEAFMKAHSDAMMHLEDGRIARYGRIGLVPAADITVDYLIAKYEALIEKYKGHESLQGICMPAENGVRISYDRYTNDAYRKQFGEALPSSGELKADAALAARTTRFLEECFLRMYRRLARHLKQKYALPLMHYPQSKVSAISHHEPNDYYPTRNLELITQAEEIDLLNLQLHPPLGDEPLQFKMELELLESITDRPFVADTHFFHETNAGKLPDLVSKRFTDWILFTLSPYGVSFFCYGFMAKQLPLWKDEINPKVRVANCYADEDATAARRKAVIRGMDYAYALKPLLEGTRHRAACAIFYKESLDDGYRYGSYYREHLFGLYELLQATALPVVFTGKIPADAQTISCLILDAVKSISAEECEQMRRFMASGGRIILVGRCAKEIYECCGFTVRETDASFVCNERGTWDFSVPVDGRAFTSNGEPLRRYDTGEGAVMLQGNACFVGASSAISDFCNMRQTGLVSFWKQLLHDFHADSGVKFHASYLNRWYEHEYVTADIYEAPDGSRRVLLLRDAGTEVQNATLEWALSPEWEITGALSDGKAFPWKNGEPLPEFEYFTAITASKKTN